MLYCGWMSVKKLTHLFHNVRREDSGGEGTAEDVGELLVQTTDAHLLKVPVRVDDTLSLLFGFGLSYRDMRRPVETSETSNKLLFQQHLMSK